MVVLIPCGRDVGQAPGGDAFVAVGSSVNPLTPRGRGSSARTGQRRFQPLRFTLRPLLLLPPLPYSPSGSESPQPPPAPSPPSYRHDGKSPLPLGMDWSHPPSLWEGPKTKWPHDPHPHTGWSYCVTIPTWILLPNSRGSDPIMSQMIWGKFRAWRLLILFWSIPGRNYQHRSSVKGLANFRGLLRN
ncbi:hypothetical protein MLD38_007989 [Melastoma candidum]|uniref:Uncharacterized protein n=1 Tax=Melastoma candidum TaxID=119954 RepID=A0ACB9RSV0_9MYRT|nr:hypothetical protein MLD38_007989 [Melastoma candidum]